MDRSRVRTVYLVLDTVQPNLGHNNTQMTFCDLPPQNQSDVLKRFEIFFGMLCKNF